MHIPFCKQACAYCNFHFTTSLRYKNELVTALAAEAAAEKDYLGGQTVNTLYFGGGTPSLLTIPELHGLLASLHQNFPVATNAEITLEANPDDITKEKLAAWKALGINRLSIGVQSFFEEELRWMNRAHNSHQAAESLQMATQLFDNITLDLIYGSPLLTDEMWHQNVAQALALGIPHLSCYALTVEEKTPLHKNILLQKTADVDSDRQARQFLLLMQWLRAAGYEHYEVSNFARPGYRSRHNAAYWQGVPYLGLGPSAHSFNRQERRWNIANNSVYTKGILAGTPQREREVLTTAQQLNETIMISLRTAEGINLQRLEEKFGASERERIEKGLVKYEQNGLVRIQNSGVQLTDAGMLRADGIAADLFV